MTRIMACLLRLGQGLPSVTGPLVRWDREGGRWFAFVLLACAVVRLNRL
jgi:hypothetical protein